MHVEVWGCIFRGLLRAGQRMQSLSMDPSIRPGDWRLVSGPDRSLGPIAIANLSRVSFASVVKRQFEKQRIVTFCIRIENE